MNDYISLRADITPCSADTTDLLAACLGEIGFESFEPDDRGLTAYIQAPLYDKGEVDAVIADFPMQCSITTGATLVEGKDWNEEWEKNYFQPIIVRGRCVIHSTFHKDVPEAEYDIVIDPKMAFGTGHHFTTRLMIGYILDAHLDGRTVIDMGSGTGILAILCAKRGAARVAAVEIDPPACENACENFRLNGVSVDMSAGDVAMLAPLPEADLFLANINRNVILADIEEYAAHVRPGGEMILSGFYEADKPLLEAAAAQYGLALKEVRTEVSPQNGDVWCALRFQKNS